MFAFLITIMIAIPPPIAVRMHTKILHKITIQSNASFQGEGDCHMAVNELLEYTHEQYPMFKLRAESECYKSEVSGA